MGKSGDFATTYEDWARRSLNDAMEAAKQARLLAEESRQRIDRTRALAAMKGRPPHLKPERS